MESIYKQLGNKVEFPEFKGGLLYMHKTFMNNIIMPSGYEHYTKTIVDALHNISNKNDVCYITIDEKEICNQTHRREGIHVDYNWFENINTISGSHGESSGGHGNNNNNNIPSGGHNGSSSGGHGSPIYSPKTGNGNHNGSSPATHCSISEYNKNGGMLLVSNYEGCRVYRGEFDGKIGDGGDCSNINVSLLENEVMKKNEVYFLNALAIHEPLIIKQKVKRSLLRINFHPNYIFKNN